MPHLVLVIVEYSNSERKEEEHEEVELLLEGYRSDLEEIIIELRSFHSQIDDTKEFINSHQVFVSYFFNFICRFFGVRMF
jgi:hypothetical protein